MIYSLYCLEGAFWELRLGRIVLGGVRVSDSEGALLAPAGYPAQAVGYDTDG